MSYIAGGNMVAYEFYAKDEEQGDKLLGILPERRRDAVRVNQESIMNWAKMAFGNIVDAKRIFFVRVALEKNGLL
jgi:hypothetical protein